MEKKSCFIIMPFSKATVENQVHDESTLTYIYENVIKKAIEEYKIEDKNVFSEISRYNSRVGSIISGIAVNLNKSDIVIADLTGLNPNVMYELGVRHTLRRGTIVISQDLSSLPSDLRDYICIEYKYSNNTIEQQKNYEDFKKELHNSITELFTTDKYDSPVLNYLNGKERFWREDELKKLKENIVVSNYIFEKYDEIQDVLNNIKEGDDLVILTKILNPIINNISSSISDLNISVETSILYEDIVAAKSLIFDISKKTALSDYFGNMSEYIPNGDNPFSNGLSLLESKFINYFKLNEGEFSEITFKEVFSNENSFYTDFIEGLQEYLDEKSKELNLKSEEIEYILRN